MNTDSLSVLQAQLNKRFVELLKANNNDSRRWFHGRGHCYSGLEFLAIDYFSPVLLVTFFQAPEKQWENIFWPMLEQFFCAADDTTLGAVLCQRRYLDGAPNELVFGGLPEKLFARRGEQIFDLDLTRQQNIGFFLDIEIGRQWLEQIITERGNNPSVLNLFAYTCAFSVVAQAAGAGKVVNVDMSRAALNRGRSNHHNNQQSTDNIVFLQENILKSWGRIKKHGPFQVLIIDPPSYQPGSFVAERDYGKLIRRIPQLAAEGADILCCLNSPELDEHFIDACFATEGVPCEKMGRLDAHPDFPDVDEQKQLKLLYYRYPSRD